MAKDQFYFHIDKLKSASSMNGRYRHVVRDFTEDERLSVNYDPELTHLNKELISSHGLSFDRASKETIDSLRAEGAMQYAPKKNAVLGGEIVIDLPEDVYQNGIDVEAWAKRTLDFLDMTFNPPGHVVQFEDYRNGHERSFHVQNIKQAVLHLDEHVPHLHVFFVPVDPKGHFNMKYYMGGREKLARYQNDYARTVADMGIKRGSRNSIASHHEQRRYRQDLKKAVTDELPVPEKYESVHDYRYRAQEVYRTERAQHHNDNVEHVKEIKALKAENLTLKKETARLMDEYGLERGAEPLAERIHAVNTAVEELETQEEALRTYPDREIAEETRVRLLQMIQWREEEKKKEQERKRKEEREKEMNRKKEEKEKQKSEKNKKKDAPTH